MKYTVDIICGGVWFTYSKEIPDESPTVKKKLVNNSQELVNELVKEKKGDAE